MLAPPIERPERQAGKHVDLDRATQVFVKNRGALREAAEGKSGAAGSCGNKGTEAGPGVGKAHSLGAAPDCALMTSVCPASLYTGFLEDAPMRMWSQFANRQKKRFVPIPPDANRRVLSETAGGQCRRGGMRGGDI